MLKRILLLLYIIIAVFEASISYAVNSDYTQPSCSNFIKQLEGMSDYEFSNPKNLTRAEDAFEEQSNLYFRDKLRRKAMMEAGIYELPSDTELKRIDSELVQRYTFDALVKKLKTDHGEKNFLEDFFPLLQTKITSQVTDRTKFIREVHLKFIEPVGWGDLNTDRTVYEIKLSDTGKPGWFSTDYPAETDTLRKYMETLDPKNIEFKLIKFALDHVFEPTVITKLLNDFGITYKLDSTQESWKRDSIWAWQPKAFKPSEYQGNYFSPEHIRFAKLLGIDTGTIQMDKLDSYREIYTHGGSFALTDLRQIIKQIFGDWFTGSPGVTLIEQKGTILKFLNEQCQGKKKEFLLSVGEQDDDSVIIKTASATKNILLILLVIAFTITGVLVCIKKLSPQSKSKIDPIIQTLQRCISQLKLKILRLIKSQKR